MQKAVKIGKKNNKIQKRRRRLTGRECQRRRRDLVQFIDMTFLYFLFIVKYTMDMNHPFQLIVLGDYMQGLYYFKGADTRFLTMAIEIWKHHRPNLKSPTFHNCFLKTSYRITNQMASFINEVMLAENRLLACREGNWCTLSECIDFCRD